MSRKSKVLFEINLVAIEEYLKGLKRVKKISHKLPVDESTVKGWITIFRSKGPIGLSSKKRNTTYSKDVKIGVPEEYLAGNGSKYVSCWLLY